MEELKELHIKVMEEVAEGGTVWGYSEAMLLRQVERFDKELVTIIPLKELEKITGEEFDGAKQLPYFGAILTDKGKEFIAQRKSS